MFIAAIDIGSNAVRLLIKNTDHPNFIRDIDTIHPDEYYQRIPLKSGIDVFSNGLLSTKTEMLLSYAMCCFSVKLKEYGVEAYRACATSAYRDAQNTPEVLMRVHKASGINIEVISGKEEARLTRRSFVPPEDIKGDLFLFADVGGGSTEISVTKNNEVIYARSFNVGSMRYVCNNQLAAEEDNLDKDIETISHLYPGIHYVGVGGCVKFMKSYLNGKKSNDPIQVAKMKELYKELKQLTPKQISRKYDIPLERADILTPASSIFLRIAHKVNASQIIVPSIGVRDGIITELYQKAMQKSQKALLDQAEETYDKQGQAITQHNKEASADQLPHPNTTSTLQPTNPYLRKKTNDIEEL